MPLLAGELHRDGHALMLRRVYRLMIRDFDDADCDRWIAEDWYRKLFFTRAAAF